MFIGHCFTHYKTQFPLILIAYVPKLHKHITFALVGFNYVVKRDAYVIHLAISGGYVDDIFGHQSPSRQTDINNLKR